FRSRRLRSFMIGRGVLFALGASLALTAPACADLPRQDPGHCRGQKELKPLQPLTLLTSRGPVKLMVEVADTEMEREYGLMCRRHLAPDRGMLFDFKRVQIGAAFWMRNTLIPLDIIYIRPDGTIAAIASNAQPLNETPIPAYGPILGVLELAGGRAAQLGLLPGDRVAHRMFKRG
ncbi:MAG TPA: DUF192 domain-containing protein, partial [Phenylobacterium sp.]|nr:DUF192 domain-containing protein [Phenylobacterium sp.]